MTNDHEMFLAQSKSEVKRQGNDASFRDKTHSWMAKANEMNYSYHFQWLGRPIIQYPQDIVALQELVWDVKPDLIIETGIARGGSLILSASLLMMCDFTEASRQGIQLDPRNPGRRVVGIDIDIRSHNLRAIEEHPLNGYIEMIQGSSIDPVAIERVREIAVGFHSVLVLLDSNHTHEHVLAELEAYCPLVSEGSYCIVYDTVIEDMPPESFADRPWDVGNNPKTAVREYLMTHPEFVIDNSIIDKLQITVAPSGYLKRIRGD